MKKVRVPLFGATGKSAEIDPSATQGAIVGSNLKWPDGSLVQEADLRKPASASSSALNADDIEQGRYNQFFTDQKAQDAVGGILVDTSTIDFTYSASAHTIKADLRQLGNAGGGSLLKVARDAYGRLSGTSLATTDDLPEGDDNAYFNPDHIQADGDSIIVRVDGKDMFFSVGVIDCGLVGETADPASPQVRIRGATDESDRLTVTLEVRELLLQLSDGTLWYGDGVTAGGLALAGDSGGGGDAGPIFSVVKYLATTPYTVTSTDDASHWIEHSGGTLNLPPTIAAGFVIGDTIEVCQATAAQVTIAATGGASLAFSTALFSAKTRYQGGVVLAKVIATDTWRLVGALADA